MPSSNEAEEPGETTAIISTHQFQPPQILRLISNTENASFHPRRRRITRRSASRMNSRERLLAMKGRSSYSKAGSQQASMSSAGLAVSLFLLAAICGAHLLRTSTTDLTDVFKKSSFSSDIQIQFIKSLYSNIHHHQPFTSHQLYNFDIQTKISQNINERFQRFVERLEEYVPSSITSASLNDWMLFGHFGERQELQVNVLLAERRRRTVQRQRSPTPIPQPISPSRFINRQRNTSSAPPDSLRSWAHLSTSPTSIQPSTSDFGTNSNQTDEPTLMDYDAIDSYWRWDIDQEKGGLSPYQRLNDFGQQLDEDYYYLNNERNFQEADILFERDIQLLTEKGLLPDQTDNLNDNEVNLSANFSRTLSFDGIIENQNENTKWNDLLQLPTSSLFVSSGQDRKTSIISQSSSYNPQIDESELPNIPIYSSFQTENNQNLNQKDSVPNQREVGCSSRESISALSDIRQPILFNDVSLARCSSSSASIGENSDNEEMVMERQQMLEEQSLQHSITNQQQSIPLADHFSEKVLTEKNQKTEKDEEAKDEAETEMLLSALFPQLFSPLPINDPRSSSQQNSPLFSDGNLVNNSEVEAILHELAAAEVILMNSTQTLAQNNFLSNQLQTSIEQIANTQQQPSSLSPLALPISPSIGPLSPIFEHFNQNFKYECSSSVGLPVTDSNIVSFNSPTEVVGSSELSNSDSFAFRYEQKLIPKISDNFQKIKNPPIKSLEGQVPMKAKGKRGRRSKDDYWLELEVGFYSRLGLYFSMGPLGWVYIKVGFSTRALVNQYDLPYSAEHLTAMSYRDYSSLMQDVRLTSQQKALIKKIRRRGRNKLAARKCRDRRLKNEARFDGEVVFDEYIEDEEDWDEDIDVVDVDDLSIVNKWRNVSKSKFSNEGNDFEKQFGENKVNIKLK
uniref:BZIP domain-containing protein n=3 Tax=Meloidogyne TaxID=189290 RepID=A0A6V7XVR9_MELEN|nr:unnamed protein product [Meloidogyne enterolobii]